MGEMVDIVAMALHDEWNGVGMWSSLTDLERRRWESMARAAIRPMRNPTEDMKEAFDRDYADWLNDSINGDYHLYTTMIDAALK